MKKSTIALKGVSETMLQTVYARASESQKQQDYLQDPKAIEIIQELDYDFHKAKEDKAMHTGVIARTILLDAYIKEYLQQHPNTAVINLGCGLDTRCYRLQHYKKWYNLDLAAVIAVRDDILEEKGSIQTIPKSVFDESWFDDIDETENCLIIMEGLLMYFQEKEVQKLFAMIDQHFLHVTIVAETMSPYVAKHMKEKSITANFTWGIKNGNQLAKLIPPFQPIQDISLVEGMKKMYPIYCTVAWIPFIKNLSNKIIIMKK